MQTLNRKPTQVQRLTDLYDSVSRMSRNAEDGYKLYQDLYNKGINLVFLKEHHIDTDTYKSALTNQLAMTGDDTDLIFQGINAYLLRLAAKQIKVDHAEIYCS